MAGDQEMLDSPDGLTDSERAEFAQMQEATAGDLPPVDPGAGAAAEAGAADGAASGDAGKVGAGGAADGVSGGDQGDAGAAAAAAAAGKDGAAADGEDDDDDGDAAAPVVGADGKPVQGADGQPVRRKARVSAKKYETEKQRADKLAADLNARDQLLARADERMRLINEALTAPRVDPNAKKPGEEEQAPPDPEQDAFGFMRWQGDKIAKLESAINEIKTGKQTEDGQRVVADVYKQDAVAFANQEPNFVPAYQHLMQSRMQELAMYFCGVDLTDANARKLTPQEIQRITSVAAEEERGIVENAIAQGRSPSQAVYQMARYRGFRPRTKEEIAAARAAANGGAVPGGNGAAKPNGNGAAKPAANGKGAENSGQAGGVTEEIERIIAGTEASLSLSDGGASPANPLTAQRLANMPEAEFNALLDRLEGSDPDAFRRLVEGQA